MFNILNRVYDMGFYNKIIVRCSLNSKMLGDIDLRYIILPNQIIIFRAGKHLNSKFKHAILFLNFQEFFFVINFDVSKKV